MVFPSAPRCPLPQKDVIVALDFPTGAKTLEFLDTFRNETRKPFVKIGMELFYAEGPAIVGDIRRRGHRIFLDLKLHDIPNTVRSAMSVLAHCGVDMVNVHAAGGRAMMSAALEGLNAGMLGNVPQESAGTGALTDTETEADTDARGDFSRPLLIAVTQLTSTDKAMLHDELLIGAPLDNTIVHYAKNARTAGLDGVVCSPLEAPAIHRACAETFLTITPGIRFADNAADDQRRITTPARARELGSDYIVVGRPITRADNPLFAYRRCVEEFCE